MTITRAIDASAVVGQLAARQDTLMPSIILSADEWATIQWASVDLGDRRLDRRAVQVGTAITENPKRSLP